MKVNQERLNTARKQAGLSLRKLAEVSGLSYWVVYRVVRQPAYAQRVTLSTLTIIVEAIRDAGGEISTAECITNGEN